MKSNVEKKKTEKNYYNAEASIVNRVLCYIENECIKELYEILDNHKCFDYEKDGKIYKILLSFFMDFNN